VHLCGEEASVGVDLSLIHLSFIDLSLIGRCLDLDLSLIRPCQVQAETCLSLREREEYSQRASACFNAARGA
jgi:hypothetical protein